jgi:hypothetical protein
MLWYGQHTVYLLLTWTYRDIMLRLADRTHDASCLPVITHRRSSLQCNV